MVIVQRGVKIGDIYARAEEQEANLGRAKGWAKGWAKGRAKERAKKLRSKSPLTATQTPTLTQGVAHRRSEGH